MTTGGHTMAPLFLGRGGRVFGPYRPEEIEGMRASGELRSFSWIWEPARASWQPLDPPPPPLTEKEAAGPAIRTVGTIRHDAILPLDVVCHDRRSAIIGKLRQVTESGCELVSHHHSAEPPFANKAPVLLNLLDPRTGQSMDVAARITGVARAQGAWSYRLQWQRFPEIVLQAVSA